MKTRKVEDIYPAGYETIADVPERLPKFIDEIYNAERLHSHLAMRIQGAQSRREPFI